MGPYQLLFYTADDGECPGRIFIEEAPEKARGKMLRWLGFLEQQGPQLLRPYADIVQGKIRELRVEHSGIQYRLLYFFWGRKVVVTHGFVKKTSAIPDGEIARAVRMMRNFYRMLEQGDIQS